MPLPVPALAALFLAAAEASTPRAADLAAREILALAATGDPPRLERARRAPLGPLPDDAASRSAAAARALAGLVLASDLRERSAASPDGEPGLRSARALREEALDELRPLAREAPTEPDVLRALALYYGLDGRPSETARLAAEAREAGVGAEDPWLDLATLSADLRGRPASETEPALAALVARQPSLLGARMSLARARVALGDADGAVAALDALLALDPEHEAARELKAALLAPPPAGPIEPRVPSAAPPPTAPGWLPRKKAATGRAAPSGPARS